MNKITKITMLFLLAGMLMFTACSKNYYSGTGKGGRGCGCPNTKGMSGY